MKNLLIFGAGILTGGVIVFELIIAGKKEYKNEKLIK